MSKKYLTMVTSVVTGLSMILGTVSGVFAAEEEPSEIVSLRSEYEKHFDNGDGTMTAFVNTVPIHYLEDGEWREIDNTLVQNESGDYENRSNSMNVTLSSGASAKAITAAGTDQMVQIEHDGYTISWDMLNIQTNIADQINTPQMTPVSTLTISDNDDDNSIKLGGERLNEMADAFVDKLDSGVVYQSVYEDVDIDIDINPTSVKETIILNSAESAPEHFAYYIMTEGLTAELQADNSILFTNDSGEVIFKMPAMYMFDSSENAENNYDIETSIEPFKAGYLLTITPDSEWLTSDERVYPVMIDPEVIEDSTNISDSYIDESAPDTNFSNQYLKMGGYYSDGTRKEAFIKYQSDFTNFHYSVDIIDAQLCLYFASNDLGGTNPNIEVHLLTQDAGQPTWNTVGDGQISSIYFELFQLAEYAGGDYFIDITYAVSRWLNYAKTNQVAGNANYGLKLSTPDINEDYRTLTAYSSRYQTLAPYFSITYTSYVNSSPYTMAYNPYKYNGSDNFQDRMNCYAYALQVYYNGELAENECYKLKPGEFGLAYNPDYHSYSTLEYYYGGPYPTNYNDESERQKFVDDRMREDAIALNFEISDAFTNVNNKFVLPSDYDQTTGRIIAMTTKMYYGSCECHFYARNGNGTCPNGHGGNCSMWSHKPGSTSVTNKSTEDSVVLCDENIADHIGDDDYSSNALYYIITKDTYIYNSWHGDGTNSSNGTPYRQ